MGDSLEKAIEQLPDIWFDWYARLLPGCFGVALYLYLSLKIPPSPTAVQVVVFLLLGYVTGHVLEPMSGFCVKQIEKLYRKEEQYAEQKRKAHANVALVNKVSKAHAEANSMFVFALVLLLNIVWFWESPRLSKPLAFVFLAYFIAATIERTAARSRKITDLG